MRIRENPKYFIARTRPEHRLLGFVVIRPNHIFSAEFVYPRLPFVGSPRQAARNAMLFTLLDWTRSHYKDGTDVDKIERVHPYKILESELIRNPYVMIYKKSKWQRWTEHRNEIAEKVAEHLHFIVPPKGIHGKVIVCPVHELMTLREARSLLAKIPEKTAWSP